ncbi:type IV pilus biogenesis protein PilM [Aquicella siphonis]|uniref:type IV pilus biogenesis protein PilM n=1 Tax=Aquicella siphonis TaxID=254247 RepID=UPI00155A2931|nr:type IV pilus assembly protein PilM [Aquicella siphonis]
MLAGITRKSIQLSISEWLLTGKQRFSELFAIQTQAASHNNILGLVINPQYIKLLKIKSANEPQEVEYFKMISIPEGLVVHTEIKNSTALAEILRNVISESGLDTKDIALTIPRSSAIVKHITVDKRLHADEVESRVWVEANRLFPNLINDIYLDFAVIGPSSEDSSQNEVLIVACRKEQLKPYLEVMRMAGLTVKVVDINYYAFERAMSIVVKQVPKLKTIAMLNISYRLIDLLVMHEGKLIYTHEVGYDGLNLVKLARTEADFINPDRVPEGESIPEIEQGSYEILKNVLGSHLKHAMQFFYSSKPNVRIDRIILAGDCASEIPGLPEYVYKEVGKTVTLADPFKNMRVGNNVDKNKLMHYAPSLMLCCGLALSRTT